MTKTFVLNIEEINYFSIKVEAETYEEAKEVAENDINQFKSFNESCDWHIRHYTEEN
tara:strand:- start:1966 stop:2136 length:171 start_codon:yes stop_codon:yes gene_type:complete